MQKFVDRLMKASILFDSPNWIIPLHINCGWDLMYSNGCVLACLHLISRFILFTIRLVICCWLCSRNSETHDENLFFCSLHWTNASDKSTMSFLLIQTTRVSAWMPKIAMKKIMQMTMEHFIPTTNPSTQCIFS